MLKIHHQIKAKSDLKRIWKYSYKKFGEQQADKYYDELTYGMEAIEENPHIGVACDYIRSGYRQYKINEHYIFYRLSKNKIHIIRVLHESMKSLKHL